MEKNKEFTQFSIYKINLEKVKEEINISNFDILEIKKNIISYIRNYIKNNNDDVLISNYEDFTLMFIKSKRNPIWKKIVGEMIYNGEITEDIIDKNIINESTSYILFTILDNKIYAMTGGRGAVYINKFIEKNYGLYLIPKIVKKNNPIIKKVVENNITGNNLSTEKITKNATSVSMEDRIGSVFRQLSIQLSKDIATEIGINEIEDNRRITILSGDSIVIRKSITLEELRKILTALSNIENKNDNFILNYFVPIRKMGIKITDAKNLMIDTIIREGIGKFELISDNISEYYFSPYEYRLIKGNECIYYKTSPIELSEIIDSIKNDDGIIHKNKLIDILFNVEIETIDENGQIEFKEEKIYNLLRGCIEYNGHCLYLLNGNWYVFEKHFLEKLDEKFNELYSDKKEKSEKVIKKYNLIKQAKNEEEYNESFKNDNQIIKGHRAVIKNVEVADLIFYDNENIYLMCNKGKFTGENVRDLENQIETSSKMLESILKNDKNLIEELYNKIEKNERDKIKLNDFKNIFNKKKVFIAGFTDGYKEGTKSIYAKYLLCDLNEKLNEYGYGLLLTNLVKSIASYAKLW